MERFWLDDSNPGDSPKTYTWEYDAIGRLIDEAFESDLPDSRKSTHSQKTVRIPANKAALCS